MPRVSIAQASNTQGAQLALCRVDTREYSEYLGRGHFPLEGSWAALVLALRKSHPPRRIELPPEIYSQLLRPDCPLPSPLIEPYYRAAKAGGDQTDSYVVYTDAVLNTRAGEILSCDHQPPDERYEILRRPMTPEQSQALILGRPDIPDFELYRLKAGWDKYSYMGRAELTAQLTPDQMAQVKTNPYYARSEDLQLKVYRWILRGLTCEQAMRKLHLDYSISANRRFRAQLTHDI